jgi:broad specificity phosphatase PhoE
MRVIDHFRHSTRTTPGKHLSREGVELARRVGKALGNYDLVVTSGRPRAIETAVAMGYATDLQIKDLDTLFGADTEVDWIEGCAAFAEAARESKRVARAARKQAEIIRSIVDSLPERGKALVVSHGGVIELGAAGLLPDHDFSSWGPSCERCEGIRLYFDGAVCTSGVVLRLSDLIRGE